MPTSAELFDEQMRLLQQVDTGQQQFDQYGNIVRGQQEQFGNINRNFREATTRAGKSTTLDKIMALATAAGFISDATSGDKIIRNAASGKVGAITKSIQDRRTQKKLQARQDFQDQLSALSTEAGFNKSLFGIGSARRRAKNLKTTNLATATGGIGKQQALKERSTVGPSIKEQQKIDDLKTFGRFMDGANMSLRKGLAEFTKLNPEAGLRLQKEYGGTLPENPKVTAFNMRQQAYADVRKDFKNEIAAVNNALLTNAPGATEEATRLEALIESTVDARLAGDYKLNFDSPQLKGLFNSTGQSGTDNGSGFGDVAKKVGDVAKEVGGIYFDLVTLPFIWPKKIYDAYGEYAHQLPPEKQVKLSQFIQRILERNPQNGEAKVLELLSQPGFGNERGSIGVIPNLDIQR